MNDLIEESMNAHGGLAVWRAVEGFSGHMDGGGTLFDRVGHPNGIRDINFAGLCHEQRMSQWPIGASGLRSIIRSAHEELVDEAGETVHESADPRWRYPIDPGGLSKWDDLNLAYFIGYSMWNYVNAPFIWTWPGVETHGLPPATGASGERLRRLRVRYPENIASHSTIETFYFSDEGLIVRVDYAPDVTGNRLAANFASEHRQVSGGLIMPTRRTVYRRRDDDSVIDGPVIDFTIDQLAYA